MHYARSFYLSSEAKTPTELLVEPIAHRIDGVQWNRFIGQYIIDELHNRLLDTAPDQLLPLATILVLISNGWLYTAAQMAKVATIDDSIADTRDWLVEALLEGDAT
jgi:hypothetical protein